MISKLAVLKQDYKDVGQAVSLVFKEHQIFMHNSLRIGSKDVDVDTLKNCLSDLERLSSKVLRIEKEIVEVYSEIRFLLEKMQNGLIRKTGRKVAYVV